MEKDYQPPVAQLLYLCAADILTASQEETDDIAEDDF